MALNWITARTLADDLGVHPSTVRRYLRSAPSSIQQQRAPGVTQWRFEPQSAAAVRSWLEERIGIRGDAWLAVTFAGSAERDVELLDLGNSFSALAETFRLIDEVSDPARDRASPAQGPVIGRLRLGSPFELEIAFASWFIENQQSIAAWLAVVTPILMGEHRDPRHDDEEARDVRARLRRGEKWEEFERQTSLLRLGPLVINERRVRTTRRRRR